MKNLFLCIALFGLVACKSKPTFQSVSLTDGKPGFMMRCPSDMGRVDCLVYADKFCHGDYQLVATNVGNDINMMLLYCK